MAAAEENARTGNHSLLAVAVGGEGAVFTDGSDLQTEPGQTYHLGVWIKVRNGTTGSVTLAITGPQGETLAEQTFPTRDLPPNWYARRTVAWAAPVGASTSGQAVGFRISVASTDDPARKLFVCCDDALLVKGDLPSEDQHPGAGLRATVWKTSRR